MDNKQYLEELRLLGEEVQQLEEKNCPTNPSKWSYYKSQAKQKFDVYPSAYANGWASKQYKAAGGGWKQCAGESMENTNENFAVHMMVAKAIADQKVKNPETKKDVRVTTALKDKQHPAHGKAKSLVQRLKDKFSKKENIEEAMITPQRGHAYYKLSKDTPIKYVSGHSGIGLEVPGVLLHNEYGTIKGKKGAYIINYFNAHFYVDIKNKFASRIAHPDNREQNKDLKKNMQFSAVAPEHSDWKKYMNESVMEGKKRFRQQDGIGKAKYTISYHDGKEKHKDGSDFFGIQIFKNKKDLETFRKSLLSKGYVEESVNEAQKVNPTSNKFLKGMKKIKVKGLGGYMPGVDYVYVDGDKYYFVDTDGDHMELKNTATIKQLHKLHGSSLGESINEAASRTAMEIGGLTGMNKDAIQKFVDDNKLDIEKVYQYVKNGKLPERMALVSAIAGKPGNTVQTKLIKKFK